MDPGTELYSGYGLGLEPDCLAHMKIASAVFQDLPHCFEVGVPEFLALGISGVLNRGQVGSEPRLVCL